MRHIWVTMIIAFVWIASIIELLTRTVDVYIAFGLTLLATFYFILYGLQGQQD